MADYLINLFVFWLFLISLVPSVYNVDITLSAAERSEVHPASDFSRHTLVKPRIFHGREKRQISTTRDEEKENEHIQHLQISLEVDGEDLVLDLTLNKDLIPQGYFYRYQQNGKDKVHKPTAQEINLCHYNGKVRGKKDSWVALSTCDGLSGVIFDGNELHYIEKETNPKLLNSNLNVPHFLYKHSDLVEHNKTCGYGGDAHEFYNLKDNRILRYKRSTDENELVRGPYNANKESKFVELVLVVDNREYKELGENMNRVKQHCKSIANIINALYAPLNIFIALVGVVVWTEQDAINFSTDGDSTLTNFLHYRRQKLIKEHPNDNAQLLTKNSFDNGVVGKALKGPICTYEYSGGVNTDHSPVVGLVATTVAHEMGHNFGMEHDTNECKCPEDRCIMAPSSSSVAPIHWSSCSLNYLLMAFTRGMDYCLKNKPKALFDSPVCGNGFVEPGEQCDCGLPEHCDNTCCNATTCMLHTNASCATGECCDLTICKPKNAGTMCRSADYECDLPEYCTGQSEYCPTDIYKMDTEECDDGKAYCYHGTCRTRTDQCKLLWGETGHSSDEQCYEMNRKGTRHGNCGYNKFNQSFFKCENDDVLCGMLHCKHLNERLEFGMESVAILSHTFINKGRSIIPCRTAIVDLGINQVDPGLTPDGARCGPDKMCVNQKCMAVASLRKSGPTCPQECNGNGWCNNFGRCHCKDGFAPPFCDYPGHGGSEDSGPASDPNARQGFVSALYIIFLGIIPFLAILFLLFYYGNRNFKLNWKKQPSTTMKGPSSPRSPPFSSDSLKAAEDNHSLLHEDPPGGLQNEFFGQFKGYTLTPLKQEEVNEKEPVRTAPPPPPPPVISPPPPANYSKPPPPVPAVTRANTIAASKLSFLSKSNSFKIGSLTGGISQANSTSVAPALPPPNPGSSARPIISSPVLENSTCTRKELISPLRNAPKAPFRAAPEIPEEVPIVKQEEVIMKKVPTTNTTLNRITSFLKPDKKPTVVRNNSLNNRPNQIKAQKILDKNALRSIEISNPIPQSENVENVPKPVVMRAQSMRGGKTTPRPAIHTFGSMRQTSGVKRPVSIPSGNRPKSPPPPRPPELDTKPPVEKIKIPSLPGYQKPTKSSTDQYDDCMNKTAPLAQLNEELSPVSSDNIYAVIEDSPQKSEPVKSSSGSSDSMGLLGEIVSEIQNRNFDSIYSTSTLARKKKEEAAAAAAAAIDDKSDTYVNTSSIYKSPESEYCNTNNIKSSASSTSSGYILPSAVNVPETKPTLSSFKNDNTSKPFSSTYTRPLGPLAAASLNNSNIKKLSETFNKPLDPLSNNNKPTEPPTNNKKLPETSNKLDTKKNTKKPQENSTKIKTPPSPTRTSMNRQITPPNLRTRKQSPTNRSITNSPDLVTSCNSNATSKAPDVVNNSTTVKKPSITSAKPNVRTVSKSVSLKTDKKDIKPPIAAKTATKSNSDAAVKRPTAKQSSNVASLQQKFENKTSNGIISTSNKTANKVKV